MSEPEVSRSHPVSVDALCGLPSEIHGVDMENTILTGSSDGLVRAVQILPTKLCGVVVDHGDWPIERIAVGDGLSQLVIDDPEEDNGKSSKIGSTVDAKQDEDPLRPHRRWWLGSVGHDEVLRLTDLREFFHDIKGGGSEDLGVALSDDGSSHNSESKADHPEVINPGANTSDHVKKRKRRMEDPPAKKRGKRNVMEAEESFFDEI